MDKNLEFKEFIKTRIAAWTELRKDNTLLLLSQKSNLGYSTVRRFAAGHGEPVLQSLMQLAAVIMSPEDTVDAISKFFPEAKVGFERPFQFLKSEKSDPIYCKESLLAVALACPDNGIDIQELESILGKKSMSNVRALIEAEVLARKEDRLSLSADYIFDPNPDRLLRWIGYVVELFDRDRASDVGSFTSLRMAGLNEEGIKRLQKVLTMSENLIQDILDDKSCRGDQSVATALISTMLNPKDPNVREK